MEFLIKALFMGLATYVIVSLGVLYAMCPINDKETSTTHRVITLIVALAALYFVWS